MPRRPPSRRDAVPSRVRARRTALPGRAAPEHAALLVAGAPDAVALTGDWAGVRAVVAGEPLLRLAPGEDPFAALDRQPDLDPESDPAVRVGGGWFGALGYELASLAEPTVPSPPRHLRLPAAPLAFHDWVLVCDRAGAWWFEALATPEREAALATWEQWCVDRLEEAPRPGRVRFGDVRLRGAGEAGHRAAIEACRERIRGGELFQANLCQHVELRLEEGGPADLAAATATTLRPAYGAFLQGEWGAVVSSSPELFLRRAGRRVRTQPVKGTAPQGAGGALATSTKDRAENVMIVDLMRNDLGRVCATGSVTVGELAEPRSGAGVVHLVSDVSGILRDEVGDAELLRASFPPGSVTGAPKVQALRMIAELEGSARELYTGAIGYASPVVGLELNVAIRTFELVGDRVQLGVGGGITAASDAAAELEECRVKVRPLLGLGGAGFPSARRHDAMMDERLRVALASGRRRPEPRKGVFETMRVEGGVALGLEAHLVRLRNGVGAAGVAAPVDVASRVAEVAEEVGAGRLRVDVGPGGVRFSHGALHASAEPVRLIPWLLPGGLGAAKWADRRLVDALAAELGATPLLIDADGSLLEAGWATVWVEEEGALLTPPLDGRILAGTARAELLRCDPRCREEPLSLARTRASERLWVSTALRGLAPAQLER